MGKVDADLTLASSSPYTRGPSGCMLRGNGRTVFLLVSMPLSYRVPNSGSSLQCGLLGTETQREVSSSFQLTGSFIIVSFL